MIVTKIGNRVRSNWTRLRPVSGIKVVGIGLPKTGTTSLGYCLRRFGYKHQTYDMDLAAKVKRNQIDEVMKEAEKHESFEDWPWFMLYKEFDQTFPNSKFILTTRKDTATYVRSLQGHHEREGIRRADFVKPHWWDEVFGVEPADWDYDYSARRYEQHNRAVLDYFAGRTDLLVVCWENGDGWAQLSRFLNKRIPNEPFPHLR
jgi:hypothetical protein